MIKFLVAVYYRDRPNAKRIKISPDVASVVERLWRGHNRFKYVTNNDNAPQTIFGLIMHLLNLIEKNKPTAGGWTVKVDIIEYPQVAPDERKAIFKKMNALLAELKATVTKDDTLSQNQILCHYVHTALSIEYLLIDIIDRVENYYVQVAKNMSVILNELKLYF